MDEKESTSLACEGRRCRHRSYPHHHSVEKHKTEVDGKAENMQSRKRYLAAVLANKISHDPSRRSIDTIL